MQNDEKKTIKIDIPIECTQSESMGAYIKGHTDGYARNESRHSLTIMSTLSFIVFLETLFILTIKFHYHVW